jgi:hypothetical protein
MSTRSTYRVINKGTFEGKPWESKLVLMYVQCDGYPEGHPIETMKWLDSGKVVDGITTATPEVAFNGAGCLAAQLVARFKEGIGGTYLYDQKHRGKCDEEYTYDIIVDSDTKEITTVAYEIMGGWGNRKLRFKKLFSGTPSGFVEWFGKNE